MQERAKAPETTHPHRNSLLQKPETPSSPERCLLSLLYVVLLVTTLIHCSPRSSSHTVIPSFVPATCDSGLPIHSTTTLHHQADSVFEVLQTFSEHKSVFGADSARTIPSFIVLAQRRQNKEFRICRQHDDATAATLASCTTIARHLLCLISSAQAFRLNYLIFGF